MAKKLLEAWEKIEFRAPPYIGNRSDALELLDRLLQAESVMGMDKALEALRDAIWREVV
jgi:hypothetical protein